MDIYIDGKLASEVPEKPIELLENKSPAYPIQFGAMNSGRWVMNGTFDELKILTEAEYKKNFVPLKNVSGKGTIFRFEENTKAASPAGLDAHQGILMK